MRAPGVGIGPAAVWITTCTHTRTATHTHKPHTATHSHTQPHSHTHDGTAHAPAGVGRTCSAGAVQRSSSWDTAFCVRTVVPPARTTLTRQHFVPSDAVYEGQRGQRACRWNGIRSRQIHPTNAWFSMLANWRGLGSLHWHGQIKHKDRRRWGGRHTCLGMLGNRAHTASASRSAGK